MDLQLTELNTLTLLRAALNGTPEFSLLDRWDSVKAELTSHAVLALTVDVVAELDISDDERRAYSVFIAKNLRSFHNLMIEQDKLNRVLDNIPFVVLKGASAAMYYPNPEYRQMGDIDIIVEPENFDAAVRTLAQHGYKQAGECERHIGFIAASGVEVELHRKFSSSDNEKQNRILDDLIGSAIAKREIHDVCGYQVPVLPKLENGLVLLSHINQHLNSGLGLRQIIDWMLYVRTVLTDEYWNTTFKFAADSIGMKTLAEATTLLCKKYLGLDSVTWCDASDEGLADELLSYILSKGNFGRKQEHSSNATVTVMHFFYNPITAIRYLTAGGMVHWKAAQKHAFLKPFAWIYQIGHLIRMGLKRKASISTFVRELKVSQSEADFLARLRATNE